MQQQPHNIGNMGLPPPRRNLSLNQNVRTQPNSSFVSPNGRSYENEMEIMRLFAQRTMEDELNMLA